MRLQGRVISWDDDKGFGFIAWHGDGSRVFVHIKAFVRASRRPAIGDIVTYEIAEGRDGKSNAVNVRFSAQSPANKPRATKHKGNPLTALLAMLYVSLLFVAAYTNRVSWLLVVGCAAMSLITFVAYWWDKSQARNDRWRTKESSLHLMSLLGGWLGALAAQRLFRHKSSKRAFLGVFWATVLVNVAALIYLVWMGNTSVINQFLAEVWRNELY